MTDNDNHKLSDDELETFLDGRDAISRAYGELDKASPPRELDARILARARKSVAREAVFKEPIYSRPYATAATVFLCLGITFLFLNDPDVPTPADLRAPVESAPEAVQVTLEEEAARAPAALADLTAEDNEADTVGNTAGAAAPVRAESVDNLLNLVERTRLDDTSEQRARSVASTAAIANPGITYRSDREDWLREIARLRSEGTTDSASQEEALFLGSYPGTDIDAALAELPPP